MYCELVYTRKDCIAEIQGLDVETNDACRNVVVYDRRHELVDELLTSVHVTTLMIAIIIWTVIMMAVDMQRMILNPIDRIAKLIKTISGRRWKKKKKKQNGGDSKSMSLSMIFEAFELETYFGLKTMNLFLLDLEAVCSRAFEPQHPLRRPLRLHAHCTRTARPLHAHCTDCAHRTDRALAC